MPGFIRTLFDVDGFPARWHCGTWTDAHGWTHIASDFAIFLAYICIPLVLLYFVLRREEPLPFHKVFLLFAAFIVSCGIGHLIEAVIFWHPVYRLAGLVKVCTAFVSLGTVVALVAVVPEALKLRSPEGLEREVEERTAELVAEQAARQRLIEELEMSNHDLRAFAYAASHDLRSPCRSIAKLSQIVLEDNPDLAPQVKEDLELIRSRADRLSLLVSDLLEYAQVDRGAPVAEAVDVGRTVQEQWELLDAQGFRLEAPGPTPARIDPRPFGRVVANLLSNSVRHHPSSEGAIRVVAAVHDEVLHVTFEDDGPGIATEHRERARQMFKTLSSRDRQGGSGMGLALVDRLVAQAGGTVELADSELGGLAVHLRWPFAKERA